MQPKPDIFDDILGPDGVISRGLAGYEMRPAQLEMARGVDQAMRDGAKLVVNAALVM